MSFSVKATEFTPVSEFQCTLQSASPGSGTKQCICIAYYKTAVCPYGDNCEHAHHFNELTEDTKSNFLSHVPADEISAHFLGSSLSTVSRKSAVETSGMRVEGAALSSTPSSSWQKVASVTSPGRGGDTPSFRPSSLLPQIKGVAPLFVNDPATTPSSMHVQPNNPFLADRTDEEDAPSSVAAMTAAQVGVLNEVMRNRKEISRVGSSGSFSSDAPGGLGGDYSDSSLSGFHPGSRVSLGVAATEGPAASVTPVSATPHRLRTPSSMWRNTDHNDKRFIPHLGMPRVSLPTYPIDASLLPSTTSIQHTSHFLGKGSEHLTAMQMGLANASLQKHGSMTGKHTRRSSMILPPDCQYPHRTFQGTYYDILGLPVGAPQESILAKYRQWHLEGFRRNFEEDAERAEKEDCMIVEARNVLGNEKMRQEYDDLLRESGFVF